MSITPVQFSRRVAAHTGLLEDRRRHKRFPVSILGRFMRPTKHEFACRIIDISVGDATFETPIVVQTNERIVAYMDDIGGIEGTVERVLDNGFAMRIAATQHKREKLAAQITWIVNRHELDPADARRHERRAVANKMSTLVLPDGTPITCRIIDVSLSGASIATETRPPVGTEVMFGRLRARVMRHHDQGIGVQFMDLQEPEALRRNFG